MMKDRQQCTLPIQDALQAINKYYNDTRNDAHGRFMSWRHCYKAFCENRRCKDEWSINNLALHLAFYLASWGMYRESSFLLQKDYTVHIPVVQILLEEKYDVLYGIGVKMLILDENMNLIMELKERITNAYLNELPSEGKMKNNTTDTLVTKILLGTLGCAPAYDQYYVDTVRKYKVSSGTFNERSLKSVAEYYLNYYGQFEKMRNQIKKDGLEYPQMKLIDMCMWQIGFDKKKSD